MSRRPFAVPLVCPGCGGTLTGSPADAALACLACGSAFELAPDGLVPIPLEFAALPPGIAASAGPALAFWRFDGLRTGAGAKEASRTGFVLAARVRRFHVHGDPGLEYTRRPPRFEPGPPCTPLPIARTRADAVRVLGALLARIAAESEPTSAPATEPAWDRALLWCVPTVEDGSHVKIPHCAVRYPVDLIEGYRAAAGRPFPVDLVEGARAADGRR